MATKKKERTFAERLKDARFTDKHLEAHQSLAQEDGAAWRAAVLERDGFAEAAKGGATGLMAWLLEAKISPDARPNDKGRVRMTPPALMQVLSSLTGDSLGEWVERLLAAGASASLQHPDPRLINPDISRVSMETPLALGLKSAPLPVVDALLKAGADPRVRVSAVAYAMTSLFVTPGAPGYPDSSPEEARQRFVKESLLAGVDLDTTTFHGRTLLHVACELRSKDAVAWLLQAGASPSAPCEREWTAGGHPRVLIPAGARPLEVLQVHREGDPHVAAIREALLSSGATLTTTVRERPSFATEGDALLEALFPAESLATTYRTLRTPLDAFEALFQLSGKLPPAERLARLAETNALAYLLYKPAFAPYIDPDEFEGGEVDNERAGTREYRQLLKRTAFAKPVWAMLQDAGILSYWPGHGEGIGDVLAFARLEGSTERMLVRVSASTVENLGPCGPLATALLEEVKREGAH